MEQLAQQTQQFEPPAAPAEQRKPGPVRRLSGLVAAHSQAALAVIVVLVVLVVVLYAVSQGWFGLGGRKEGAARRAGRGRRPKGAADDAAGDEETERLIDSINRFQP